LRKYLSVPFLAQIAARCQSNGHCPSQPGYMQMIRHNVQITADDDSVSNPFDPFPAIRPKQPFVVAQMGQSLDGRIATITGHSRYINRPQALDHLHRLRAHVDAVVVGIGTVLSDDPALTVRRVTGKNPARVIIDPSGRIPENARCLRSDGSACYIVRAAAGAAVRGAEIIVAEAVDGTLSPLSIVAELHARGMGRILVEGGSRTISCFIEARAIDRLHVLVAPLIIGSGRAGLELPPIASLDQALRPVSRVHLFADGDVLFDCDLRLVSPDLSRDCE
jgi:diaminohydroxyphosphoribosylaminopyrimidine deaminase / 5-amino-6-(5-phosphoribosylamino)uracil reductase